MLTKELCETNLAQLQVIRKFVLTTKENKINLSRSPN